MPASKRNIIVSFLENNPGLFLKDIAKRLNVCPVTVQKYAKEIGYKPKTQQKYFEGKKYGPQNTLLVERINGNKCKFICSFCGKEFYSDPSSIGTGLTQSCGCLSKKKSRESTFVDITGQKFGKLTALYPLEKGNAEGRAIWHCRCDCGREIDTTGRMLRTGHKISCGCSNSKGNIKIKDILIKMDITFEEEKKFENFVGETGVPYRFDFYLPDYNCCIEYDGEQHFEYTQKTGGWNTLKNFEKTQYRDLLKNKYCDDNNIKLIRIPYWDYDKLDKDYIWKVLSNE